jgi:RND family efflux transporter MFP subunit
MKRKGSPIFIIIGIAVVLIVAVVIFIGLKATAPKPKEIAVTPTVPSVRVHTVEKSPMQLEVRTQGVVEPSTQTTLVTEVTGKIINVSPAMEAGSFFKKGEVLLQIDPRDYESALAGAIADIARAEADLATETAEAEQARKDWERMGNGREASDLLLRLPQLARVEANLTSAKAAVSKARNDLERTRIVAPYAGRSREKMAEIGQFAGSGTQLGQIFATDYVEIRLPLSDSQLGKLSAEVLTHREGAWTDAPAVTLNANVAGKKHSWQGKITRIEGVVDEKTRFYYVVAKVDDPYGILTPREAPLTVGMFVEATIAGRSVSSAAVIPRNALHPGNKIYLVDKNDQLQIRSVQVISSDSSTATISDGIQSGERVIVTNLATPIEGMKLVVTNNSPSERADVVNSTADTTPGEPDL